MLKGPLPCPVSRQKLQQWLEDGAAPLSAAQDGRVTTILKIPKTEEIDYLYVGSSPGSEISWSSPLECCGVYDRRGKALYLITYPLTEIIDGLEEAEQRDSDIRCRELCAAVNRYVEDAVANDRRNLSVSEITSSKVSQKLADYCKYIAKSSAVQYFMNGQAPDGRFRSGYKLDRLPEDAFIAWLQDPEVFIRTEAERFMERHQEEFLAVFLKNDALLREYEALLQDTGSEVCQMRAITEAVSRCGAKAVTVTVKKAEGELSFKVPVGALTGYRNFYSTRDIAASDRRRFENLFGSCTNYSAEEITKITYGRNTLYEAPSVQAEELETGTKMGGMELG